ncbi:MAG: hypothetical protein JNK64_36805 [Myxococcales bacterium]|nr:hypothetical protein [Myxococcales bacterium]
MNRRAVGAALCAAAAFVLVLALAMPWWRVIDRDDDTGARATFGLAGGEQCVGASTVTCKEVALDGRPGARDDLFAWAARSTLALAVVAAALAVTLAFAGGKRRPPLRAAVAIAAGTTAAAAAATVAIERLPASYGTPSLGAGLWLALLGCALLTAGAAWPIGPGDARAPLRRWGLAAAAAVLVLVAWVTLAQRGWWHGDVEFGERSRSPLGFEVCDLGTCARFGNGAAALRSLFLLGLVAATAAATAAIAAGLVVRAISGVAVRGWATATLAAAGTTLAAAVAALAAVPSRDTHLGLGAWLFVGAIAALAGVAIAALRALPGAAAADDATAPARWGAAPAGPKPVLAPLGGAALASPAPPPAAPTAPPAIAAYAPALSPAPPSLHRPAVAPAPLAPRPSPYCPTCRVATLWHAKRAAWWCSTCKRTL